MNLKFDTQLAEGYHSESQIARVLTESWMVANMFCPRCGNSHIEHFENNRPVADFYCPNCLNEYELKSKHANLGTKIGGGSYDAMLRRITENNNPDLFCMQYDKNDNRVVNLIFIPKQFFTSAIVEKRNPLKETARRAGWVGCNILIGKLPEQAKIKTITNGMVNRISDVVHLVGESDAIIINNLDARGWLLDVLNCINSMKNQEFILEDIYRFESILATNHPQNNNIRAKIRQQLQTLRDKKLITFLGNGKYKKT